MSVIGPWIEHLTCDEHLTRRQAEEMLEGWDLIPFIEDDVHMATIIKRGAEVHFAAYAQYRSKGNITARRLRAFLLPILKEEGFLVTKLGKHDTTERFITRLGFVEMGVDQAGTRTFILTDIKPLEKQACTTPQ